MKKPLASLLILSLLAGCNMAPDYKRPDVGLQPTWKDGAATGNADIPLAWWGNFGSPTLTGYVEQALAQNTDIEAAKARVKQARASLTIARSALYPSVDATAGYNRDQDSVLHGGSNQNSRRIGVDANYTVDIFGQVRSNVSAALSRADAAKYERDAVALTTASDVANAYLTLLAYDARLALSTQTIDNQKRVLELVNARFAEGAISGLDVEQQKNALASAEASYASLVDGRNQSENALSILRGVAPEKIATTEQLTAIKSPAIQPQQPATLLQRRPDIRATEATLIAANADIGAARAALFPSVSLGAGIALASGSGAGSEALSLSSTLLAPIFNAGRLRSEVRLSEARQQELAASYRGAVLIALNEAENALSASKAAQQRLVSLTTARAVAQRAYDISLSQYREGLADFQSVLDSQRALFTAEDSLILAQFDVYAAAIDLYAALGGGWNS
jgi:multidrug efflux system outer membrane protein